MVAGACNSSSSGGWGRRITGTWEVEVAVSKDHTTALQLGLQSEILSQKKRVKEEEVWWKKLGGGRRIGDSTQAEGWYLWIGIMFCLWDSKEEKEDEQRCSGREVAVSVLWLLPLLGKVGDRVSRVSGGQRSPTHGNPPISPGESE